MGWKTRMGKNLYVLWFGCRYIISLLFLLLETQLFPRLRSRREVYTCGRLYSLQPFSTALLNLTLNPLKCLLNSKKELFSFIFVLKIFYANHDSETVVYNVLAPPITARLIRILPVEWHNQISMRLEVYGCPG